MVLYFSNSACHAASLSGGTVPVTGRHSTIESPEPVSRVPPPTAAVRNTSAATASSQARTKRRRDWNCGALLINGIAWMDRLPWTARTI